MRRRVAALIALSGLAALPAVSGGTQPSHPPMLKVLVKPSVGSPRTGFAISFRPGVSTAVLVPGHHLYRITAADPTRGRCQSSAVAQGAPAKAGSAVRVVLSARRGAGGAPARSAVRSGM